MLGLSATLAILLVICLVAVCIFEFINGFHDTANAVATVIYTHSLRPVTAVVLSGTLNFLGVITGGMLSYKGIQILLHSFGEGVFTEGIGVATSIIKLLPVDLMLSQGTGMCVSVILATLLTAIIWNLGTWYFGIPCSSSHTLIGSIIGAGIGFSLSVLNNMSQVNWSKAQEIFFSLLLSPAIGFCLAFLLVLLLRHFFRHTIIFLSPKDGTTPPFWVRVVLIMTCSLVSFFHGSNDGQKGVSLALLVLICFAPSYYALNYNENINDIPVHIAKVQPILQEIETKNTTDVSPKDRGEILATQEAFKKINEYVKKGDAMSEADRFDLRKLLSSVAGSLESISKSILMIDKKNEKEILISTSKSIKHYVEYAPFWIVLMISVALGIGTMIGWKRIVVTIGERIGKDHLTYAQGASAEIITALTIGVSTSLKLPVSTTHILSSGVAGSMVAKGGLKNLRAKTVRNIILAWVLTLPVCIVMATLLFYVLKFILV